MKYIGHEFTDDYINESEDVIMAVGVFHLAKSYYIMKEIGYYQSKNDKKNRFPKLDNKECKVNNKLKNFALYKLCKFLVDKSSDDYKERNIIINILKEHNPYQELKISLDDRHYKILFYIYNKMLGWNCWN